MAELVNGHVTISIGLNGNGGRRAGGSSTRLSENDRLLRAQRLRRDGFSYRRIAVVMGVSYSAVARLLDGDEAQISHFEPTMMPLRSVTVMDMPAAAPPPSAARQAQPARAPSMFDELVAQNRVFQQRLDQVVTLCENQRQSLLRLERSLIATMQTEHRALGQRLQAAVKAMLERMLPATFRPRASQGGDDDAS